MKNFKITKNFSIKEFLDSKKAKENNIKNNPSLECFKNIIYMTFFCLQPLRDNLGVMQITSGYRCIKLNRIVDGAEDSDHLKGLAVDLYFRNPEFIYHKIKDLLKKELKFIPISKVFLCYSEKKVWLHISCSLDVNYRENNKVSFAVMNYVKEG